MMKAHMQNSVYAEAISASSDKGQSPTWVLQTQRSTTIHKGGGTYTGRYTDAPHSKPSGSTCAESTTLSIANKVKFELAHPLQPLALCYVPVCAHTLRIKQLHIHDTKCIRSKNLAYSAHCCQLPGAGKFLLCPDELLEHHQELCCSWQLASVCRCCAQQILWVTKHTRRP
jgi:hypothetical protein